MENIDLERAVLDLVRRPDYQPAKARGIAQQLGLPRDQVPEVKKTIKRLVSEGRLVYATGRHVEAVDPARPQGNRLVGVFRRMESGSGFVRPRRTSVDDAPPPDVYVPARGSGDASTGDTVLVQITRRRGGKHPGPRGEIVKIIERQTHQFVGTYFESDGLGYVQVDGNLFARPILVGDPGAKGAAVDDKVVIDMVRFPSHFAGGEAVITEVLGPQGEPGVDTLLIFREYALPERFPDPVVDEARQEVERFDESIPDGRLDLTRTAVITIDPVDARDFDDAISLERQADGHWLLGVHIADVSHFVRPKSALDREAFERATSVYLPDRVVPMLPELISNGVASLQPGKVRYTKTVLIEYTPEGIPVGSEFHSAAVKSRRRLTYEQVDAFLADPAPWRRRLGAKVHDLLRNMHELAMILRARRIARGALELCMPDVKIDLDGKGRVTGAHVVENTESHQIIEEFMLAANEAVARALADRGLHFLRRVHKDPTLRKLQELTEFIKELGFRTESLESRFALQKLLAEAAGRPERHAVHYAVLRSLQRAVYSPEPEGHYALASDGYCHFTSPIRRYPDLTVHRMLEAILAGKPPRDDLTELMLVGEHCSQREQRAESAERELTKLKLLHYLSEQTGREMDVVVTGVETYGLFVQGIDLPAEGLIHVGSLADDVYRFDRTTHTLAGYRSGNRFRLGDLLRAAVLRVDLDRRELDFRLLARKGGPTPATPRKRAGSKPSHEATRAKRSTRAKKTARAPGRRKKRR
jgi:ribonuclease R